MLVIRKLNFGFGTLFSLIVVYFIYLYSKVNGWVWLALISKWYLIIVGGLITLLLVIIFLIILLSLLIFLITMLKLHKFGKKYKRQKTKEYIDVEYKIKE